MNRNQIEHPYRQFETSANGTLGTDKGGHTYIRHDGAIRRVILVPTDEGKYAAVACKRPGKAALKRQRRAQKRALRAR